MQRIAAIDSVVLQVSTGGTDLLTAKKIETLLGGHLEILKCSPVRTTKEQRKEWRNTTGRPLPQTAAFIALIHHERGQSIPLIRYGASKGLEIHLHGLQQYQQHKPILNDGAIQRREILDQFLGVWDEPVRLSRFDHCVDLIGLKWSDYSNTRDHRSLCKRHTPERQDKTTTYYQPPKPTYVKVLAYDKQGTKDKLRYPLTRIEFCFKRQYWRGGEAMKASDILAAAILKTDAYIKRVSVK
jgi:hypothetical protein